MIGYYSYTVILTYLSLVFAMAGIHLSFNGMYQWAFICLIMCGICDTFDGMVARSKKNRTDEEKQDNNLYRIVEKEVEGAAERGGGTQPEQVVYQPVGKLLYHNRLSFFVCNITNVTFKNLSFTGTSGQFFPQNLGQIESGEPLFYQVASLDKGLPYRLGRPGDFRGVLDADVQPVAHLSREGGATLAGVVAHGDDIVPRFVQAGCDIGRAVMAYVDAGFGHHLDGLRVDLLGRMGSCRENLQIGIERL